MPRRPGKPCTIPGCRNLVYDRGRCLGHRIQAQRLTEQRRPPAHRRGYDKAWEKRRAAFIAKNPVCRECGGTATEADHEPSREELLAEGVPDPDDEAFLVPLCKRCHSRKTVRRDGGFGRRRT